MTEIKKEEKLGFSDRTVSEICSTGVWCLVLPFAYLTQAVARGCVREHPETFSPEMIRAVSLGKELYTPATIVAGGVGAVVLSEMALCVAADAASGGASTFSLVAMGSMLAANFLGSGVVTISVGDELLTDFADKNGYGIPKDARGYRVRRLAAAVPHRMVMGAVDVCRRVGRTPIRDLNPFCRQKPKSPKQ